MRLPFEVLLLTLSNLQTTASSPVSPPALSRYATPPSDPPSNLDRRSASFLALRGLTSLTHDYSRKEAFTHPEKFFHESTFDRHYDGRFASTELPHHTRMFHLRLMLRAYITTMDRIGVRTWLMHGCLLGWWWNGKIMPWDNDVDVMVDEAGMGELGGFWNMSVHHFSASELNIEPTGDTILPDTPSETQKSEEAIARDNDRVAKRTLHEDVLRGGKKYLLEVNPHYANASTKDEDNVIDARWIDTGTGLFIDITAVHVEPPSTSFPQSPDSIPLYTKDQHAYTSTSLFPLRLTTFEDIPLYIPYDYESLLLDEYGPKALTHTWYRDFHFDGERLEWIVTNGYGVEEDEEVVMARLRAAREKMDYLERVEGRKGRERWREGNDGGM